MKTPSKPILYEPPTPIYDVIRARQFGDRVILTYTDNSSVSLSSGGLRLSAETLPRFAIAAKRFTVPTPARSTISEASNAS